jgi:hypothetical protein
MEVLMMAKSKQEIARVKALQQRVQNRFEAPACIHPVSVTLRDLANFARHVTWYL